MNLYIYDKNLDVASVIDAYSSLIWTKKHYEYGDFKLYLPASLANFDYLKKDYLIKREDDETVMIIEKIQIDTDSEAGNFVTVTGRSLESILARRIIWEQTTVTGTPENRIRKLIDLSIVNPTIANRKISNFSLNSAHNYTGTSENAQYTGDNLYDIVSETCKANGLGFCVKLVEKSFVFDLLKGSDFSYNQTKNPYVVFSPYFENLISSEYYSDKTDFANIARIFGEGEGTNRKWLNHGSTKSGLERYELYVDARDISQNSGSDDAISDSDYYALLKQRGIEKLAECKEITQFSGTISTVSSYQYKTDYNVGDTVQIENEYGFKEAVKITEITESFDENGYTVTPTFETNED
jgi:hypothetical protein